MTRWSPSAIGGGCASLAVVFFSTNDTAIKFLSADYALHQVVLTRSLIGLLVLMIVIAPLTGGWAIMRTQKLGMHLLRGAFVVAANMLFFLGLAAMPLAEAVAIFFVSPLVITVFSIVFLGEHVGPRRWVAIAVGMIGVLIILRPGTAAFQLTSLLPLSAAVAYGGLHMLTRKIGPTESAATMAFYIQIVFIVVSISIGLAIGDGRFMGADGASLQFLFRPWQWPASSDWPLFGLIGVGIAFAGYLISQAYRVAEAGFVAPFEYLAMPLSVLYGYLVFSEIPDRTTLFGASLIVGSGLFTLWRETHAGRVVDTAKIRR